MAAPTSLLWDRDPHTKAKHDMLSRYLDAWFPIVASKWSDTGLTYAEGFAGPGEYLNGGMGSPLLALQAATRPEVSKHPTDIRMIFVEKSPDRLGHLKALVEQRGLGRARIHTPYPVVERFGASRSSEVLITLKTQWFARFATVADVQAGDIVFGETGWRDVAHQPAREKKRFLTERYLGRLHDAGFRHTLTFEMIDEGGNGLFLIFGTDNLLGVEKMKDAMWSVDKVRGQRFRDPRDLSQLTFEAIDTDPDLALLSQQLVARLKAGPQSLENLKDYALRETMFKKAHTDPAVRRLEAAGEVERTSARRHEDVIVQLAQPRLF
jgi:hypothetical protein